MPGHIRHPPRQEGLLDERGDLELVLEPPVLLREQAMPLARVPDAPDQQVDRQAILDEVVLRAALHRLDGDVLVVETTEHDDGRGLPQPPDRLEAVTVPDLRARQPQQDQVVRTRA